MSEKTQALHLDAEHAAVLRLALDASRKQWVELLAKLDAAIAAGDEAPGELPAGHLRVAMTVDEAAALRFVLTAQIERIDHLLVQLDVAFPPKQGGRPTGGELANGGTLDGPNPLVGPCRLCGAGAGVECAADCITKLPTTPPPGVEPDDDDPEAA